MWNLIRIDLKNIFSHKNTNYIFEQNKTIPIFGYYKKNSKIKSNGAGKSTLLEGINIAICGSSIRNINANDIIYNGEDYAEINLLLKNNVLREKMLIYRKIYSNSKSGECIVYINNQEQKHLSSVNEKNEFIFKHLGISKIDFHQYFLINKDNYVSFTTTSNTNKIAVINRFSKADKIDLVEPQITLDIAKEQLIINALEKQKIQISSKIDVYTEELEKRVDYNGEAERMRLIESFNAKIEDLKDNISSNNLLIDQNKENIKKYEKEKKEIPKIEGQENLLEEYKKEEFIKAKDIQESKISLNEVEKTFLIKDVQQIQKDDLQLTRDIKKTNEELLELNGILSNLEKSLQDSIECPKCTFHFNLKNKDWSYTETTQSLKEGRELEQELEDDKKKHLETSRDIEKRKKEYREKIQIKKLEIQNRINEETRLYNTLLSDIEILKKGINKNKDEIFRVDRFILNSNEKIKNLEHNNLEIEEKKTYIYKQIEDEKVIEIVDPRVEINNKIELLQKDLLEVEEKLQTSITKRQDIEKWIFIFKRFKSYLANKSISSINGYCNMYLKEMKADEQVIIEGFKTLKNGSVKESIDIQVLRDDSADSEALNKFSGGQKSNIDLSFILALRNLINVNSESGGINFLGIDEILESVDENGIGDILNGLNKLNETIYLVTHVPVSKSIENPLVIEYNNKISSIATENRLKEIMI